MKKLLGILVVLSLSVSAPAFASNFGPAQPNAAPGNFYFGIGAQHHEADWETDGLGDENAKQNRLYAQLGYVFDGGLETYLKVGTADLEYNKAFGGTTDFDAEDGAAFASVGLKGQLKKTENLEVAFFLEGGYMGSFDDRNGTDKIEFEESFTADAGLIFQMELEGAYLYGGPVIFFHEGDFNVEGATPFSGSFEEENNFGGLIGISWPLKNGVNINIEGQQKSDFSFGGGVTFPF